MEGLGERIFPEEELNHLDGHKSSKPVRFVFSLSSVFYDDRRSFFLELETELLIISNWQVFGLML